MQLVTEPENQPMLLPGNRKLIFNNTLKTFFDNYFVPPTKSGSSQWTAMDALARRSE